MSRGHGVRQRQILDRLRDADARGRYVTPQGATPSDAAALRRAAYQLEREGLVKLRIYGGRLAMWRPDVEPPIPDAYVDGRDGRLYRTPYGDIYEDVVAQKEEARAHRAYLRRYGAIAEAHGHPHGLGIFQCFECAEAADAPAYVLDVLDRLRP